MFSIITFFLNLAVEKEEEETQKELETCFGRLVWYRERFGEQPNDIDYHALYLKTKNQRVTEHDHEEIVNGKAAINEVSLWSPFGWEKDKGTFYLSTDAILFSGTKNQTEIKYTEISSINNSEGMIKIKTIKGKSWRFDEKELARYGISLSVLKNKIH